MDEFASVECPHPRASPRRRRAESFVLSEKADFAQALDPLLFRQS